MHPPLSAGARVGSGALLLGTAVLGVPVVFYGTGALVDALLDRGLLSCDDISCGIGTGFVLVLVAAVHLVLSLVLAVVLPLCVPRAASTRRALLTGLVAGGGSVVLLLVATSVVWLFGPSSSPP